MLKSVMPEIVYRCDLCGELFNTALDDAQSHNQKVHTASGLKDDSDRGL